MVKRSPVDPYDNSLQMKIRQYLVSARRNPTEAEPNPKVFCMRVFARNQVVAKTRFWWNMKRLNKLKRANGQILAVNEVPLIVDQILKNNQLFEKTTKSIKTYGIVLRYQSRTTIHNIYKEFRDITVNGAISQLYQEMAGNHRTDANTIQIIRTSVIKSAKLVKRSKPYTYMNSKLKFPVVKTIPRSKSTQSRGIFKATRPNTFQC